MTEKSLAKVDEKLNLAEYGKFLNNLKLEIRQSQIRAAMSVNAEVISLYWKIGKSILRQQSDLGWGAKVIDRLARDLRNEFPEVKGFSPRNLKYMRAFAET